MPNSWSHPEAKRPYGWLSSFPGERDTRNGRAMREYRVTCTIKPCMGCTDHLSELEARYRKAQAEAWKNRARQLKGDNLMLHDKVEMLHRHLAWYRHKVTALKEENEHLREKLARYRELEPVPNGGK